MCALRWSVRGWGGDQSIEVEHAAKVPAHRLIARRELELLLISERPLRRKPKQIDRSIDRSNQSMPSKNDSQTGPLTGSRQIDRARRASGGVRGRLVCGAGAGCRVGGVVQARRSISIHPAAYVLRRRLCWLLVASQLITAAAAATSP